MTIPNHLYRGAGKAWAAINDCGEVVGLIYMNHYSDYTWERLKEETGRKLLTDKARRIIRERSADRFQQHRTASREALAKLGTVVGGTASCFEFYPSDYVIHAMADVLRKQEEQ